MKTLKWRRWRHYARAIHRDVGYFLIGAMVVYGLSGLALTLRDFDVDWINIRTAVPPVQLAPALSPEDALAEYNAGRGALPKGSRAVALRDGRIRLRASGTRLYYAPKTGIVSGHRLRPRAWLQYIVRLHYNREASWRVMAMISAAGLLLLVVTGIPMVVGRAGFLRRGLWIMLGGLGLMGLLLLI